MTIASGKLSMGKETKEWSESNNYQVEPWQMKWLLSQSWNFYSFCLGSSWSLSMTYSEDWDGNAKLPPYEIKKKVSHWLLETVMLKALNGLHLVFTPSFIHLSSDTPANPPGEYSCVKELVPEKSPRQHKNHVQIKV